jgi:hypothetical protein
MKIIKNNQIDQNLDENSYEVKVLKFLGENGFILPENKKEMDSFLKICEESKFEIPKSLNDPLAILKRGIINPSSEYSANNEDSLSIEINLAQAAREGKEIPDHVKKKMEEKRNNINSKD